MVLIGNKTDLEEASRRVFKEEVVALVKGWGNCVYLETSAKEKLNVAEAYTTLLRKIIEEKRKVLEKTGARETNKSCSCAIQ